MQKTALIVLALIALLAIAEVHALRRTSVHRSLDAADDDSDAFNPTDAQDDTSESSSANDAQDDQAPDQDVASYANVQQQAETEGASNRMAEVRADAQDEYIGGHGQKLKDAGVYTRAPTGAPTSAPTAAPTAAPTVGPTQKPVVKKARMTVSKAQEYVGEVKITTGIPKAVPVKTPPKKITIVTVSPTMAIQKEPTVVPIHKSHQANHHTMEYGGVVAGVTRTGEIRPETLSRPHQMHSGFGGKDVGEKAKTEHVQGKGTQAEKPQVPPKGVTPPVPKGTAKPLTTPVTHLAHPKIAPKLVYGGAYAQHAPHITNANEVNGTLGNTTLHTRFNHIEYGGKPIHSRVDVPGRCVAWGQPAWVRTFDGKHITFAGVGEFVLYADKARHEQINVLQRRDGNISRFVGVAFRNGKDTVSIDIEDKKKFLAGTDTQLAVRFNGEDVKDLERSRDLAGFEILEEGSVNGHRRLTIVVKNQNGTKAAITVYTRHELLHFDVFVQVPGMRFNDTEGICGTYNFRKVDELTLPAGRVVDNVDQFATRWSVVHPVSTQFTHYTPTGESPVIKSESIKHMTNYAQMPAVALHKCKDVPESFVEACAQQLVTDATSMKEVLDISEIATQGAITVDAAGQACVNSMSKDLRLGGWSDLSPCSAPCGTGVHNRTRPIYIKDVQCGAMSQKLHCRGVCADVDLWGKCAVYGAGHVAAFDGAAYEYTGSGEYVVYQDKNSRERFDLALSHYVAGSKVAYATGAAVRYGADTFSMQLLAPDYKRLSLQYNGELAHIIGGQTKKFGLMTVTVVGQLQGHARMLIVVKVMGGSTFTMSFDKTSGQVHHIDSFIEVHSSKMGRTLGLCGPWNMAPTTQWTTAEGLPTPSPQIAGFSWRVDPTRSLFSNPIPIASDHKDQTLLTLAGGDKSKIRAVRLSACEHVNAAFINQCIWDVLASGIDGIGSVTDASKIVGSYKQVATPKVVQCLKQTGTRTSNTGKWSSQCSVKCGGGTVTRQIPVVDYKNHSCGSIMEFKPCNTHSCPIDCLVSAWSTYSSCSNRCGSGIEWRFRNITREPEYGGKACPALRSNRTCEDKSECCEVSAWSRWSDCSGSAQHRNRTVNFEHCGHTSEIRPCCEISIWSNWSSCQGGKTHRNRFLKGDADICNYYEALEERPCCTITDYGQWTDCAANGTRTRTRKLLGDKHVCDIWDTTETEDCCNVGIWSPWSKCAGGKTRRHRHLIGGKACGSYNANETEACCHVSRWKPWTECSNGTQVQEREVAGDAHECAHIVAKKTRECCVVDDWSGWSECGADSWQHRTRKVEGSPTMCHGHLPLESRSCCKVSAWGAWSKCHEGTHERARILQGNVSACASYNATEKGPCCSVTGWGEWSGCHGGHRVRHRKKWGDKEVCALTPHEERHDCCDVGDWSGWSPCLEGRVNRTRSVVGSKEECKFFEPIEAKPCCHVHDWSAWTTSCTNGHFTRVRVLEGDHTYCQNWPAKETKPCCEVGVWGSWSKCSTTGVQHRLRSVNGSTSHCGTLATKELRKCCSVGEWSDWNKCFNGKQERTRTMTGDAEACAKFDNKESQPCCQVGQWSEWSKCSGKPGTMFRERKIEGHEGCASEFTPIERVKCGILDCKPGEWSAWTKCTQGNQKRSRMVYGEPECTKKFPLEESRECGPHGKCSHGQWSEWSHCQNGTVSRYRELTGNCQLENTDHTEVRKCNCSTGQWTPWSVCKDGYNTRSRTVTGVCLHQPDTQERKPCDCAVSEWSVWSQCGVDGSQYRVRQATCRQLKTVDRRACCFVGAFSDWSACNLEGFHHRSRNVTDTPRCRALHNATETKFCCKVSAWSKYSECDETGYKTRTRAVSQRSECLAQYNQSESTNCCQVGNWSKWTDCKLNDAWQLRYRTVTDLPVCKTLYESKQNITCCSTGDWSAWSVCSDDGVQTRSRHVSQYDRCLEKYNANEHKECCLVKNWSAWSACEANGTKTRTRYVTGTDTCLQKYTAQEEKDCCDVGNWSAWSSCDAQDAWQTRNRTVSGPRSCFIQHPEQQKFDCCKVGAWQKWGDCDENSGLHQRERFVSDYPRCLREYNRSETKDCCVVKPWGLWSGCDSSGHKTSRRFVTPTPSCLATHNRTRRERCCYLSAWSEWSACRPEDGYNIRERQVTNASWCTQATLEKKSCCNPSKWSEWGQCDIKTGFHVATRTVQPSKRCTTLYPPQKSEKCCVVSKWSELSACSLNGTNERVRTVEGHPDCQTMHHSHETHKCCYVGPWSAFGPCEHGMKWRSRHIAGDASCKDKHKPSESGPCCTVGEWGTFGACNGTHSVKKRLVQGSAECKDAYPSEETRPCVAAASSAMCACGQWSQWTSCSDGLHHRTRAGHPVTCHSSCAKKESKPCEAAAAVAAPSAVGSVVPQTSVTPVEDTALPPTQEERFEEIQNRDDDAATDADPFGKADDGEDDEAEEEDQEEDEE